MNNGGGFVLNLFYFFHKRIRLNFCCQIVLLACVYSFARLCEAENHWRLLRIKITVKNPDLKGPLGLVPGCCKRPRI